MSVMTNIEWATSTGNPWIGCTEVSPGCVNCYAKTMDVNRFSKTMGGGTKEKPVSHWGKGAPRFRTQAIWKDAPRWNNKACYAEMDHTSESNLGKDLGHYVRPRIFPSLCDWLDPEVPIEWLADFLKLIYETAKLDWLLLTKRPENFNRRIDEASQWMDKNIPVRGQDHLFFQWMAQWESGTPPTNVWIGASVEDQPRADERIPELIKIPAAVRFLSVEPLLKYVNLRLPASATGLPQHIAKDGRPIGMPNMLHWVIVGGESGPRRRDCGVRAIEDVADQCRWAGVPCFVKQDCAYKPGQQGRISEASWALKQFPKQEAA